MLFASPSVASIGAAAHHVGAHWMPLECFVLHTRFGAKVANLYRSAGVGCSHVLLFGSTGRPLWVEAVEERYSLRIKCRETQMILCEQVCVLVRCIVCERLRWSLYQRYDCRVIL